MIELHDFSIGYGEHTLLCEVETTIEKGKLTALIGRNGTGKSDFYIFEITAWNGDQISDIAVSSGSKINSTSNVFFACKRKLLDLAINVDQIGRASCRERV